MEDISESMQEDGTLEISLVGTDVDDSELSYEIVSDVSKRQVSISGSKVTYVPSANENGTDQFSY